MSFSLVLNSTNVSDINKSTFTYNFTKGNFNIPDGAEIMITNIQIPYSFYNITSSYANNTLSFSFPTGTNTYATDIIVIPDGFYTTTSLNYYLQQWMISKGYYLVDSLGKNVYYYQMSYNVFQYGNQLLSFIVPTSLPSGYSYPSGYNISTIFNNNGFPTVSRCPYITIANNITNYLGFSAGSFPPDLNRITNYSINSTTTPQGSNINSIIVRCSLVSNTVSFPSDIIDSFPISGATFGSNINYSPSIEKWVKMTQGSYSSFIITLCDQNLNNIVSRDSNVLITLMIKLKK
jgi:hypothetical protein